MMDALYMGLLETGEFLYSDSYYTLGALYMSKSGKYIYDVIPENTYNSYVLYKSKRYTASTKND